MTPPTTSPASKAADLSHPSGDKRYKLLEVTMKKHGFQHHALIEVLHQAQSLFGYLEPGLLYFIAHHMKLPPSRIYGVATFYHFFSLKPAGEHTCVICTGTACYVKGADNLIAAVEKEADIQLGETTEDGKVSLLSARCLGACGIAPAVVMDGVVKGHVKAETLQEQVKGWLVRGSARTA